MNRVPFAPDEWYHCYSRGVDKRTTFESEDEYALFIKLLYVCNSTESIQLSNISASKGKSLFRITRGEPLVHIGAYCLMPNHFHLLLKDCSSEGGGISRFMQKIGTAYTMRFNIERERTGNLFVKPFRSRYVNDDQYFRRVAQYIHFNPIELFEPGWKEGKLIKPKSLMINLMRYRFSSLRDFEDSATRPEAAVLHQESVDLLRSENLNLGETLLEAREYYSSLL